MTAQIEMFEIESPCVGVCEVNKKGYCFGCLRSRQERQYWFTMSNEERKQVIRLINLRKHRIVAIKQRKAEQLTIDFQDMPQPSLW